jgi:ketosteroid isomerase-like protein
MSVTSQQDRQTAETIRAIRALNDAINRRDIEGILACMTDDIVWDTTTPPDGQRFEGKSAVRAAGEALFAGSQQAHFEEEELAALEQTHKDMQAQRLADIRQAVTDGKLTQEQADQIIQRIEQGPGGPMMGPGGPGFGPGGPGGPGFGPGGPRFGPGGPGGGPGSPDGGQHP